MKLNVLINKKGSALLWCILLIIILTILLGSIAAASYAYFNYTMYSVKRQQAYFTARSAVNVLLEEFASEDLTYQSTDVQKEYDAGVETGRIINFDGNYIDSDKNVVDVDGDYVEIVYRGETYELRHEYIDEETGCLYDLYMGRDSIFERKKIRIRQENVYDEEGKPVKDEYGRQVTKNKVSSVLVRKPVTKIGKTESNSATASAALPAKGGRIDVTDFGFDSSMNMGKATATISRDEDDVVTIHTTAYYPDPENGEKYEITAKVTRSPIYFGGVAIKNLVLNNTVNFGENTDLYWNNTDVFNTAGNEKSLLNKINCNIRIDGNLVTKGDAYITAGSVVANRTFYGNAIFNNEGKQQRKIWSNTEYIISNKELTAGNDSSTTYTESSVNKIGRMLNGSTHSYYCNNYYEPVFGRPSIINNNRDGGLFKALAAIGKSDIISDIVNDNLALKNSNNDALAIQYIEILSLSNTIDDTLAEMSDGSTIEQFFGEGASAALNAKFIYDPLTGEWTSIRGIAMDILDVSYIDFDSSDRNTRGDDVVPLTYMFVDGGKEHGVTTRIRYGAKPDRRTRFLKTTDGIINNVGNLISNIFDINETPSYMVVYLEPHATIELGYDDDGNRSNNPEDLIFMYSIYGGDDTTVVLHDGITVVGEIICDNLIIDQGNNGVNIVYSSTNGSQVAKQKIAEFWTVANYKEG